MNAIRRAALSAAVAVALLPLGALSAHAANCSGTSTGQIPLPELAGETYRGVAGGLYPDGTNTPPPAYAAAGLRAAASIVSRDAQGRPDPSGRIVLLSIGMSNTTMEFSAFVGIAKQDALRDPHVVLIDGAQGGQDAKAWADPSGATWRVVEDRLRQSDVTDAQVGAVWLKQAQAQPTSDFDAYTRSLAGQLRQIADFAAKRYPNLAQVFLSPRTYAGYATTPLNPEPYAYWAGFADKVLVGGSVADPAAPWIGWGPYLWTDGAKGRSGGLVWTCQDVREDGTHPSDQGRMKVAQLLERFFDTDRFASWYRGAGPVVVRTQDATAAEPTSAPVLEQPVAGDERPGSGALAAALLALAGAAAVAIAVAVGRARS